METSAAVLPAPPQSPSAPPIPARPTRTRLHRLVAGIWLQAGVIALVLGTLENWGNQGPLQGGLVPGGYAAGVADQYVLSPFGLHWADPDRFAGDWFMQAAPQPHWFFDILTFVGSSLHHLSLTYFLFWCAGLLAFGLATTLLVRHWTPRHHWLIAIAMTVVMSTASWSFVGTGTSMISFAIPAAVGGNIVYLFAALLLTGHLRAGAAVASLVAIVHVQEGAVAAVILICVLVVDRVRTGRINRALVAGLAGNVAFVAFGLWLRPVAANPGDFVQICNRIIPYHCASHTWSLQAIVTATAFIVLALATILYVAKDERGHWVAIVGLPSVALLVGVIADHFQIPLVGHLAQSVNVYRLGVLIAPFTMLGLLIPLTGRLRGPVALLAAAAWVPLMIEALRKKGWQVADSKSPIFLACLVLCVVAALMTNWTALGVATRRALPPLATAAFALVFLVSAIAGGKLTVRGLDIAYIPDATFRDWGQQVERVVPAGQQLLAPPLATYVRAVTYRGVVVDCKNIPYGGTPWREWNDRIGDLGGWRQCVTPWSPEAYNSLSARELDDIAGRYDIHYLVLEPGQLAAEPGLEKLGWRIVLGPQPGVQNHVLSDAGS